MTNRGRGFYDEAMAETTVAESPTDLLRVAVDVQFEHVKSIVLPEAVVVKPDATCDADNVDLQTVVIERY